MLLTYLMLFVALCLSAVAAFYSIIGLTAIFAAAVWPIVIMGTILEAAKLVVTVWLHEYWREVKLSMKIYLVPAVFTLMVITSMGIFGFLSKAHLDQVVPTGDVQAQVALIDEKITNERDTIANARTLLGQLDRAVSDLAAAGDREVKNRDGSVTTVTAAERSLQVRRQQARDRAALTKTIEESQARIVKLQEEKAPFAKDLRKIEAEVGPIKYIAALIYGDNPDANLLEKAVRWVIIILVIVFDPLAIMMLLAATESYRWERERRGKPNQEEQVNDIRPASEPPTTPVVAGPPQQEPDSGPNPDQPPDSHTPDAGQPDQGDNVPVRSDGPDADQPEPHHRPARVDAEFIEEFHEPDWPERPGDYRDLPTTVDSDDEEDADLPSAVRQAMRLWKLDHPGMTLKEQRRLLAAGMLDHEPWLDYLDDARIKREPGFGDMLPDTAYKGDMFVITSVQPTSLFKYNGEKWISIDKDFTDQYAYNDAYIDYLINQISSGAYDADLLSEAERSQIAQRLKREI